MAHHQVLGNDFINLDDQLYVTRAARVQGGLSLANVWWALTSFDAYNWHPLTWVSHMTDVQLWGLNPSLHHLTSLAFHAANAMLLFAFLTRTTGAIGRGAAVAAIFAVHPIHVESVAWIAERKDVLFAFFYLATLFAYALPWPHSRRRWLATLALCAAALLAKPMAVTLPLAMLLVDWWPLCRIASGPYSAPSVVKGAVSRIPHFALAGFAAVLTLVAQNRSGTGTILYESSLTLNFQNALVSFARYLGKAMWPTNLAVIYPFRLADLTGWAITGSAILVLLVSAAAWHLRRRGPYLLFGWSWFVLTLLPVIGVVRFGRHAIADRYTYIPLIGIYVTVVWGLAEVAERARFPRRALQLGLAGALVVLASLSVRQEMRWRSSITLFEHTLRMTSDNAVAHINLGVAYAAAGDYARAAREGAQGRLIEARDIVEFQPSHPVAHYRLGNAYAEMGRHAEAVESFRAATRLDPAYSNAFNNLGVSCAKLGRFDEAIEAFTAAVRVAPGHAAARENLEALLRARGPGPGPGVPSMTAPR